MNDSEHPQPTNAEQVGRRVGLRLAPWIQRHPQLARVINVVLKVIGIILFVLLLSFCLFLVAAFLFGSSTGKIVLGTMLVVLSWLWRYGGYLLVFLVLFLFVRDLSRIYEKRERLAQERHEQVLKALEQIRGEPRKFRERLDQQSKPPEQTSSRFEEAKIPDFLTKYPFKTDTKP